MKYTYDFGTEFQCNQDYIYTPEVYRSNHVGNLAVLGSLCRLSLTNLICICIRRECRSIHGLSGNLVDKELETVQIDNWIAKNLLILIKRAISSQYSQNVQNFDYRL